MHTTVLQDFRTSGLLIFFDTLSVILELTGEVELDVLKVLLSHAQHIA